MHIYKFFRNISSTLYNKEITAFLRHSEQCLFPSPQNALCFTNLSRLVLKIFRFFEKHAQNLNTPHNNPASWDLHMRFNLMFKGLKNMNIRILNLPLYSLYKCLLYLAKSVSENKVFIAWSLRWKRSSARTSTIVSSAPPSCSRSTRFSTMLKYCCMLHSTKFPSCDNATESNSSLAKTSKRQ